MRVGCFLTGRLDVLDGLALSSLSRSLTAASKVSASGTQKTICKASSGVDTVITSPSGFAFHPLGSTNLMPASS
jgi:hypothetical protein